MSEQQDKEFEAFLSGRSDLTRPYRRFGGETPPPEVDARILAAAREAAQARRDELGPRGGWLKPVALAATVLLSLSVVMNIVIDSRQVIDGLPTAAREPVPSAVESPLAGKVREAPVMEMELDTAPAPGRSMAERPPEFYERSPAADELAESVSPEAPRLEALSGDARTMNPIAPADVPETADRPAPDPALAIVARYVAGAAPADVRSRAQSTRIEKSTRPAEAQTASPEAAAEPPDPEALLRQIDALRLAGKDQQALARLADFLERYPDHPVSVKIRQAGTE